MLICALVLASIAAGHAASPAAGTLAKVRALIVERGPYAGAPRLSDRGGINWYFANVALTHALPALAPETRRYLDAYLKNLDPQTLTIDDVAADDDGRLGVPQPPDSHDAYAATFVSLAVRYVTVTHDVAWWRAHREAVKAIVYRNILTQIKPDGLVAVYQAGGQPAGIDLHEASIGYLIDNCEVYAALRTLAFRLQTDHDPEASYYATFVAPLGDAIAWLFDAKAGAWRPSDDVPQVTNAFYPDCLAQVYPGLYGVSARDPAAARRRAALSYRFLKERCHPGPSDPTAQLLTIAAYAAGVRHDTRFAESILKASTDVDDLPALAWRLAFVKTLSR